MKKYRIGVIRAVTLADQDQLELHGKLLEGYFPQFETFSLCIEDQPTGVHNEATERLAAAKVVKLAKEMAPNADAIIVSCASDPGVEILKKELSIPVIGAGDAAGFFASRFGHQVAVLGVTEKAPEGFKKHLGDDVPAYVPDGVGNTLDLLTEAGYGSTIQKALEISNSGADAIAIACTGMTTIKISKTLEEKCGIPVVDPVLAEGLMAYFELLQRDNPLG